MLTIRDSQMNDMAGSSGKAPVRACPKEKTWIEFRMVDEDGKPAEGVKYRVKLPDGSLQEGSLDSEGKARFEGIEPGSAEISFPEVDGAERGPA